MFDADPEPRRAGKLAVDAEYRAGISAYHARRFAEALAAFDRCRERVDDTVLRIYAERCRAWLRAPPEDGWTGVETLGQK